MSLGEIDLTKGAGSVPEPEANGHAGPGVSAEHNEARSLDKEEENEEEKEEEEKPNTETVDETDTKELEKSTQPEESSKTEESHQTEEANESKQPEQSAEKSEKSDQPDQSNQPDQSDEPDQPELPESATEQPSPPQESALPTISVLELSLDKELPPSPPGTPLAIRPSTPLGMTSQAYEPPATPLGMTSQAYEPPATPSGMSSQAYEPPTPTARPLTLSVDPTLLFFEHVLAAKEIKKNELWKNTVQRAADAVKAHHQVTSESEAIFAALEKTCATTQLATTKLRAIDGFVKLFEYRPYLEEELAGLVARAVDVIAECLEGEGTDAKVELQVIRALMHCILAMPAHGAVLLKAVRLIYNVFVFSLLLANQAVAQGLLTQVINDVYHRIGDRSGHGHPLRAALPMPSRQHSRLEELAPVTLANMEQGLVLVAEVDDVEGAEDVAVKDAYLVFRAMCKILVKLIEGDAIDMRLHLVRLKLLLLHIIHTVLKEHIDVFLLPGVVIHSHDTTTPLIQLVKPYICQLLLKNAGLPLAPVYELLLEMFWLIISNMRLQFKREIPVFWTEIYMPVAEMKTSTPHQKRYLLLVIERICNDLRCIIEFYLNYDCEKGMPNVCERLVAYLSRLANVRVEVTPAQRAAFADNKRNGISVYDINRALNLTLAAMTLKPPEPDIYELFPVEYALKMNAIACVVGFLRLIYTWAHKGISTRAPAATRMRSATVDLSHLLTHALRLNLMMALGNGLEDADDPLKFELLKQRKKLFLEGVKQFNAKGKKGIAFFIAHEFIPLEQPEDIARFLLSTPDLDKQEIGEYLGEGDPAHVAIMHAFVDEMDFTNLDFVAALRLFLQLFRLPGEAQKIDRFMLKFAERYVMGNPGVFANADTAYVLAYLVIMLNTDQHLPQIKNRMTVEAFIGNNTGIDDGADLDPEFLTTIYNTIRNDEIKLQLEQHAALLAGDLKTPQGLLLFFGQRDVNKEAYFHAYREMALKTEQMFKDLAPGDGEFHAATHVYHVKLIFDTMWMIVLPVLTLPLTTYDDDDICRTCLEGIKLLLKISCMFDFSTARDAFLNALVSVEKLYNYDEMKTKSVEAMLVMLEVAATDGAGFHELWKLVLTAISQIERLQLIAQGVDHALIPDVLALRISRTSVDTTHLALFFALVTPSQQAANKFHNQQLLPGVAAQLLRTAMVTAIDRVFSNLAQLPGELIVKFVQALSEVLAEEIASLGQALNPRTFSLQKIVDVCYYNMLRIRLEWSQLWLVMGEIFNTCGCHTNPAILFFALDSLRQLLVRFFDIDELANFKFQREFLRPFEHIIVHNPLVDVKDMVLECIHHMIQAKADRIKSGWRTIFAVLTAAAHLPHEKIVSKAFTMATAINNDFADEVRRDLFGDLVGCFAELAKNERFQRVLLLALDVIIKLGQQIGRDFVAETDPQVRQATLTRLWLPVFSGFHQVIIGGDELEVRLRALSHLFDTIRDVGAHFDRDFWTQVWTEVLLPFFNVVDNKPWLLGLDDDDAADDKLLVWLLTTLIQALNGMVSLFSHYYDALAGQLPLLLHLLVLCVCQENDTIAKIGRECLYSLLVTNAAKFGDREWAEVLAALQELFTLTTATELFTLDPLRRLPGDDGADVAGSDPANPVELAISLMNQPHDPPHKLLIVVKSVLQLLMIQTLSELFEHDGFYEAVPYSYLVAMARFLQKLYEFSHTFNDDYDLRVRLWNSGVIERLPNLLKQELSSLAVYLNIMFRMYCDEDKVSGDRKREIMATVIPLCQAITERFSELEEQPHQRNITIWKPVIVEIYQGYCELDDSDFVEYAPAMYAKTLSLFDRLIPQDLRGAMKQFLTRAGEQFIYKK